MDPATLDLIKRFEGRQPAGWDYKQWSGPYGVRVQPGERIDLGEAERRLSAEVAPIGGYLDRYFPGVTMSPEQRRALTSFTYNVGNGWMSGPSRLATAVRAGDWTTAAQVMQEYNKAGGRVLPGLVTRRAQEAALLAGNGMQPPTTQPQAPVPSVPSQGQQPMDFGTQPQPSPWESFSQRLNAPMTQQGIGLFLAAMQGKDLNEGLNAGAQRGNMALQQDAQRRKEQEQMAQRQRLMQALQGGNPAFKDVPAPIMELSRLTQDVAPIGQFLSREAKQTDDILEYQYAVKGGFKGSFQDWMVSKRSNSGEYAKQLVYGVGPKGEVVPMQAGTRGDLVASKLPDGVTLQRDPLKVDLGDRFGLIDPTTRQMIGVVPKHLDRAAEQRVIGEERGKALASLPQARARADETLRILDQIRSHPGMRYGVGFTGVAPGIAGTQQQDFIKLFEQAKGTAFLTAFDSLRNAGAITEVEGRVATDAIARMSRTQTLEGFKKALDDYERVVKRGLAVIEERSRLGVPGGGGPQVPAIPGAGAPQAPAGFEGFRIERVP